MSVFLHMSYNVVRKSVKREALNEHNNAKVTSGELIEISIKIVGEQS